jgi:hypothetical protein
MTRNAGRDFQLFGEATDSLRTETLGNCNIGGAGPIEFWPVENRNTESEYRWLPPVNWSHAYGWATCCILNLPQWV